ncbi:hypothetical protein LINGRAHAP2_LOCUS22549 [Linum grandiflorum]
MVEGICWIASRIRTPVQGYVRDGLDIKVCLICKVDVMCPPSIVVYLEEQGLLDISVVVQQARDYTKKKV